MPHSFEWRRDRRRVLLPILIFRPTPSNDLAAFEATALVDTGSTTTGITPQVVGSLGLTSKGKRPIGSVQGEGQAERYLFRIGLALPDEPQSFPFVFDDIEGFELKASFQFDALLGMDILGQCDLVMSRSGRCSLTFG